MNARIWTARGGKKRLIIRCIECPGMPKCVPGFYGTFPASGVIPKNCRLRKATHTELRQLGEGETVRLVIDHEDGAAE